MSSPAMLCKNNEDDLTNMDWDEFYEKYLESDSDYEYHKSDSDSDYVSHDKEIQELREHEKFIERDLLKKSMQELVIDEYDSLDEKYDETLDDIYVVCDIYDVYDEDYFNKF